MTSKIKAQNLVVYNVPLDNEGKEFKKLHINTTLLKLYLKPAPTP